uniref:Uncharacterized protein n=1 Tax=Salarias fasciatus TaxID=181472 RepID=A0A672I6Z8_SALFA
MRRGLRLPPVLRRLCQLSLEIPARNETMSWITETAHRM